MLRLICDPEFEMHRLTALHYLGDRLRVFARHPVIHPIFEWEFDEGAVRGTLRCMGDEIEALARTVAGLPPTSAASPALRPMWILPGGNWCVHSLRAQALFDSVRQGDGDALERGSNGVWYARGDVRMGDPYQAWRRD